MEKGQVVVLGDVRFHEQKYMFIDEIPFKDGKTLGQYISNLLNNIYALQDDNAKLLKRVDDLEKSIVSLVEVEKATTQELQLLLLKNK